MDLGAELWFNFLPVFSSSLSDSKPSSMLASLGFSLILSFFYCLLSLWRGLLFLLFLPRSYFWLLFTLWDLLLEILLNLDRLIAEFGESSLWLYLSKDLLSFYIFFILSPYISSFSLFSLFSLFYLFILSLIWWSNDDFLLGVDFSPVTFLFSLIFLFLSFYFGWGLLLLIFLVPLFFISFIS